MDSDQLKYATVHFDVRKSLDISFPDYIFLDMVHVLSGKYGRCYKSVSALANDMGMTFTGIKKMINRLVERELLVVEGSGMFVSQAFMDIAYFNKTGVIIKSQQSSIKTIEKQIEEKATVPKKVTTPVEEAINIAKEDEILQIDKNSTQFKKVNSVQKSELSSDKNNNKNYIKNNNKHIDENAMRVERALFLSVQTNYPKLKLKDPNGKWAEDIEKIHRIEGYDWNDIVRVADWSQRDSFWKQNIRSGSKLRAQFETLMVRAGEKRGKVY